MCRQPSLAVTGEGIPETIETVQDKIRKIGVEPKLIPTEEQRAVRGRLKKYLFFRAAFSVLCVKNVPEVRF